MGGIFLRLGENGQEGRSRPVAKERKMIRIRASRRTLLALTLAVGLTAAPLTHTEARPSSRRQATIEPRAQETSPLAALWSFLVSLWSEDGSTADPFGRL
jgi:hypothetical protein